MAWSDEQKKEHSDRMKAWWAHKKWLDSMYAFAMQRRKYLSKIHRAKKEAETK